MSKVNALTATRIWGLLLITWGVFILLTAQQFPRLSDRHPGPALFPAVVGIGFLLAGLLLALSRNDGQLAERNIIWYRGLLVLGLCLVFPWITPYTGFVMPLGMVVALVAWLSGLNGWRSLLTGGVTGILIFYLFTQLLHVPL